MRRKRDGSQSSGGKPKRIVERKRTDATLVDSGDLEELEVSGTETVNALLEVEVL